MASAELPNKKTQYHSNLREACEAARGGKLRIRLRGEVARVLDSKFRGKLPYAPFVVDGEEQEREYQVETQEIRAFLDRLPFDEPIYIEATGAHAGQRVAAWDEMGRSLGSSAGGATPAAPVEEPDPPAETAETNGTGPGEGAVQRERRNAHRKSLAAEFYHCLDASHRVVERFRMAHGREPTEAERGVAASIFIEFQRSYAKGQPRVIARDNEED